MKFKIPKPVWLVLAVLVCFNVGTLMAQSHYDYQTWQWWCCVEEAPVSQTEECPPEEVVSPPPIPEKPAPVVVYEPMPEPEPPVPAVSMPEPPPTIIETVVFVPIPTPEPQPAVEREKPLPATASNWLTRLLLGFTMIGLAFGIRRRCAA
jgi:hypothetical protein